MKDKLFIDNVEVDLPEGGSGIVLNRAVSKPADMSAILSGFSYTIQLPKTAHNIQAFGFSTEVNVDSIYPHVEHSCRMDRDGVTLFNDGIAVVKSSSITIDVLISWGKDSVMYDLSQLKMYNINIPDVLPWDAKKISEGETDYLKWVKDEGYALYYPKAYGSSEMVKFYYPGGFRPAIKIANIFDSVFDFKLDDKYRSAINNLWMFLPTTKGNKQIVDNLKFDLIFNSIPNIGYYKTIDIIGNSTYIGDYGLKVVDNFGANSYDYIHVPKKGVYSFHFDIKADDSFVVNIGKNWEWKITEEVSNEPLITLSSVGTSMLNNASVELQEDDRLYLQIVPTNSFSSLIINELTCKYVIQSEDDYKETTISLAYPIKDNLPDITILDFIKGVMGIFGFMYDQGELFTVDDVIQNKANAIDITSWLIDNKEDKLEYSYGLTKKNVLKYKEGNASNEFASFVFKSDTYDNQENVVVQLPFAATEGPNIVYTDEDGKFKKTIKDVPKIFRIDGESMTDVINIYGDLNDYGNVIPSSSKVKMTSFTFDGLSFDNFASKYWQGYLGVFSRTPRICSKKAILPPGFLSNFSFKTPLYANGNYYMPLAINNYAETGVANIELALLDGVELSTLPLSGVLLEKYDSPIKFDLDKVALYNRTGSEPDNGKMIRELDDAPESLDISKAFVAIDKGAGPALKVPVREIAGNVPIVKSTDPTDIATEENIFSALASLAHFLRKDAPDTAEKLLKLMDGAEFGEFVSGMITGKGGKIWPNGHAELASLLLRGWLEVPEIRYNRVQVVGGELWVTDGAKFDTVTQRGELFDVKIKLEEGELVTFWVGDILKGVYHDKSTDGKFIGFRTLWFRVTAVDQNNQTITVASRYPSDSKFNPVQFLEVARIGSFTEESRQRSILIDSKENCITFLDHVNTWDIAPSMEVCWLGRKDRIITGVPSTAGYNAKLSNIIMSGKIFQYDEISGSDYLVPIDKGTYVPGNPYAYYDRVSAPGGLWLCVNEAGTSSAPAIDNPDWLLQVSNGTSLTPTGNWNPVTKYSKGMIVYLDGDSYVFTSDIPGSGVRPLRNPGGFLTTGGKQLTTAGKRLYTGDPYHPWQLLAEAGKDGFSIVVQYSADKINWHDTFNPESDKYMRQLQKDGAWTEAMQIVGEDGQESPYTSFEFAVNSSLTDAPTSGWQDAPPFVERGQYLWMRSGLVIPPASAPELWTAVRIGGVTGDKGINYISENYSPYSAYKEGDVVPFNGGKIYCKKDNTGQTPVPFLSTGGKLLKTGNFYLLYKPLSINTINTEYWEVFVDKPVKEEIEQTFTAYFVGSPNVTPPTPILTGNSLGWSTTVPTTFNWVSQKRAVSIAGGAWSKPVRMTAEDGKDGLNATTRWLTSTTSVIRFNSIGTPTPSSVVVSCKKQTGILPVEACTDLYLVYRIYADTTYISQSNPSKVSSVTIGNLRTDGVYYVRGYEKLADAQAWNGNFTTEFTITHANDGHQGEPGITGASPRSRGIWNKSVSDYVWNNQWRDIVFVSVNGVNQQYTVKAQGTVPANIDPTSEAGKSYWEAAQQFKFIATDLLLSDKIKGDMIDTNTLKAKFIKTDSDGVRLEIAPHESVSSNLLQSYDGTNKTVVRLGATTEAYSGFIGIYTDASANLNNDYHIILHRDEIEFSFRATPYAISKICRIRMKESGFTIYSNSWLSESQASSGEVYKDANSYLKVK